MSYFATSKKFKKFLDADTEADDFQNLISFSLSTDKAYVRHKICMKIRSAVLSKVANRQTGRQTDKIDHTLCPQKTAPFLFFQ